MKASNQLEEVRNHLNDFGHITSLDAIKDYGVTRLSDKIYLLRKEGLNIETLNNSFINRYGNHSNYAVYKLKK